MSCSVRDAEITFFLQCYINNNHKKYLAHISWRAIKISGVMCVRELCCGIGNRMIEDKKVKEMAIYLLGSSSLDIISLYTMPGLKNILNINATLFLKFPTGLVCTKLAEIFLSVITLLRSCCHKHAHKFNALCYSNQYTQFVV